MQRQRNQGSSVFGQDYRLCFTPQNDRLTKGVVARAIQDVLI